MKSQIGIARIIGPSRRYSLPIELDPVLYQGSWIYGTDGLMYYSNGSEWKTAMLTTDDQFIAGEKTFQDQLTVQDDVIVHGNVELQAGSEYRIDDQTVLDWNSLGNNVVYSSLTHVGDLESGSITSGFGNIDIGNSVFSGDGSGLFNVNFGDKSTDELTEGANLYFTTERVISVLTSVRLDSNYQASSGDILLADTSAGSFEIALPANPTQGDFVILFDGGSWKTNNLTIKQNGSTIEHKSQDLVLDMGLFRLDIVYTGSTWKVYL